jgi:sarcosine oxidase, subunit gamma
VADLGLTPRCALGGDAPRTDRFDGLTIAENPGLAMASLAARAGREADVAAAAKALAGLDLPGPGGMAAAGDWAAFWTGPGQWMLTAPVASHEDIAPMIKAAAGNAGSVTEQTDGWARFEITGAGIHDLLERLCNVDVRMMREDQATRCQIEHLGAFLLCRQAGAAFSILTLRSAAASMMHALETAARSL